MRRLPFVVAGIVGDPTLFKWAMLATMGLYVLGLAVDMVDFIATHVAAVGLGLLDTVAVLDG